jgi:hypothetical protein
LGNKKRAVTIDDALIACGLYLLKYATTLNGLLGGQTSQLHELLLSTQQMLNQRLDLERQ